MEITYKYKARFHIIAPNGDMWVESSTPLWNDYKVAQDNAEQYAEYVNTKTNRRILNWEIVERMEVK